MALSGKSAIKTCHFRSRYCGDGDRDDETLDDAVATTAAAAAATATTLADFCCSASSLSLAAFGAALFSDDFSVVFRILPLQYRTLSLYRYSALVQSWISIHFCWGCIDMSTVDVCNKILPFTPIRYSCNRYKY
jgi:hypothetical protein